VSRLPSVLFLSVLLSSFLAPPAVSQATFPFTIRVQQAQNVLTLGDGGTVTLPADAVGVQTTAMVTLTYLGTTANPANTTVATIELTGSTDFSVTGFPPFPATVATGQSISGVIRYVPTSGVQASGRVAFTYVDGRRTPSFSINLIGVAPEFAFSFTPQGGNATPVSSGGTVMLPLTAVDATSTSTFAIINRGSGAGVVKSISSTGDVFELVNLPLPDTTVDAGKDLRFGVSFTPEQLEAASGSLSVQLFSRVATFVLQGSGSGPLFSYEAISDSTATPVAADSVIKVPDVAVGEKSSLVIRVRNTGNADGQITAVSASGTGYELTEVPFLPLTLTPGNSFVFTVNFSPTQAGSAVGRLKIGADTFGLSASGLGPIFAYSYVAGTNTVTVQNNGTVIFTPAAVGGTSSAQFIIGNTGTAPATVSSIGLAASSTIFTIGTLPQLPLTIDSGTSASFTIEFAPTAVGTATATLNVDTQSFTLSASGTAPAALPAYSFDGPTGAQPARGQPAIGLRLASPYSLPLTGTLKLAFNSEVFSDDPAVQFATGGRTINFTIPADGTQAVFPNNETQVRIQTGTVAGAIAITPSFATQGGIDLTPNNPPLMTLSVAQAAPVILGAIVSSRSAGGFTLQVTGYSTARSVTQMDFQFTPVAGESVATTKLSLNVEAAFIAWYQSSQSQQFGSLFTATIPFTAQGDVKNVGTATETIQSLSLTLTNHIGVSAAQSVSLQ
jgi:hypothetical protein